MFMHGNHGEYKNATYPLANFHTFRILITRNSEQTSNQKDASYEQVDEDERDEKGMQMNDR